MFRSALVFTVLLLGPIVSSAIGDQSEGDIRLYNAFDPAVNFNSADHIGRFEIFLNGTWGTVCKRGFDVYEGDIACRELGYPYAYRFSDVGSLGFLPGTDEIKIGDIDCLPNSTYIFDCDMSSFPSDCDHSEDMVLDCTDRVNLLQIASQTGRTAGLSTGRLQIFINEECGTVCSNSFDREDADLACRHLEFNEAYAYTTASAIGYPLPPSSVPVWLDNLQCSPNDNGSNIQFCPQSPTGLNDCQHSDDVILSCLAPGNLRLVDNSSSGLSSSGRLEIFFSQEWGTICDTLFAEAAADIACRQLGFSGVSNYGTVDSLGFPEASPSTRIWLDEVFCASGSDLSISQCRHLTFGIHNCDHSRDIALQCSSTDSYSSGCVTDGDLRLIDETGLTSSSTAAGRLEIFHNGLWGTICIYNFDHYEGDIACRQLGFLYADVIGTVDQLGFLEGRGRSIKFGNFNCSLGMTRLIACSRLAFPECFNKEDTVVMCSNTSSPLRLVSTSGNTNELSSGRLEVFISNTWGTVCADGFDIDDANVACRQLGLDGGNSYTNAASLLGYPEALSSVPIWLDDLECTPEDTNLRLCRHAGTGLNDCQHSNDVILVCIGGKK